MMKLTIQLIGLSVMSLMLSACSIDSSLFGVTLDDILPFQKAQGAEIVSGSSQYVETVSGNYKVNASVGSVYAELRNETTSGNYEVHVTVQGQMIKDDE